MLSFFTGTTRARGLNLTEALTEGKLMKTKAIMKRMMR